MPTSSPIRLILASGSPARRELLERTGIPFTVHPAHIDEPTGDGFTDPRHYVQSVAWLKARAVADRFDQALILAADTVGWLDGRVIGKPADEADARRILTTLGGREHELWTGVVLWRRPDDLQICWQEMSRVFCKAMSPVELDTYLRTRQWEGCSGAYAIQEHDDPYVQLRGGSLSNVIGLPLESLLGNLSTFGLTPPH
ncbi:MAG: Maf family protein [Gemmataceae bacterium]|nr:Maf family protein [Gemmataceae bacterium]